MRRPQRRFVAASVLSFLALVVVGALHAEDRDDHGPNFLPNGMHFPNENGTSQTISSAGRVNLTGPFFQSLGTNGRACVTCHEPSDGMSVSAAHVQDRFDVTQGRDPIFRTNDGSNCDSSPVATLAQRRSSYSLLRTRGLIRVAINVPTSGSNAADYTVTANDNQYGCTSTSNISEYRRPLPSTNLRFLSAVMWDGRESSPLTGNVPITFATAAAALNADLKDQSNGATRGHAQGTTDLPQSVRQKIVDFEMSLTTAQATTRGVGNLSADGASGGVDALTGQNFFISINSSVHPLDGTRETPGGLNLPGDNIFDQRIFDIFGAWAGLPSRSPRAAIARGQTIFNTLPIVITGVAGINDDAAAGGIVPGGVPAFTGTCGTCHDTPNVGNHSFATPLNIGTGDPDPSSPNVNLGGLDISYLPRITVCKGSNCTTTTDLGQALIDGRYDHVGKIKGPILRGLSTRAPYFHNGSARTLLDAVKFYERRFHFTLTVQAESDLVAFLGSL